MRDLQGRVQQVCDRSYGVDQNTSAVIEDVECAAACLGVCGAFMTEPFHKFREPERRHIEQAMKDLQEMLSTLGL